MPRAALSVPATLQAGWTDRPDPLVALWGWDGHEPLGFGRLRALSGRVLGMWWPDELTPGRLPMALPDGRELSIDALQLAPSVAVDLLLEKFPRAGWSPSLRWFQTAVGVAVQAAATGRALPALETSGLRWEASWALVDEPALDAMIDRLALICPPAVWGGGQPPDPHAATRSVVAALTDAACRHALSVDGWRPELGSSRTAAVVALRRLCAGLTTDPVVVGTTARHESAFAVWSEGLSEIRTMAEGAAPTICHGRLIPPDDPDQPWIVSFEVATADDPSLVSAWADVWAETDDAVRMVHGGSLSPVKRRLAALANRLADRVPEFATLTRTPRPHAVLLSTPEVTSLLLERLEVCETIGVPLLVPAGLVQRRRARITARATPRDGGGPSAGLGQAVVAVNWAAALGDTPLDPHELEELAAAKSDLVRLRGQWVHLDAGQLRAALDALVRHQRNHTEVSPAELVRMAARALTSSGDDGAVAGDAADVSADGWLAELLAGLPEDRLAPAGEPPGFTGTLRPYQQRALGWLQFLGRLGMGGCLADDMGLGKTPTTLAHLVGVAGDRPSLVLCPLSVVHNWESEAARFAPGLRTLVLHGAGRLRGEDLAAAASDHDLVVTTYGTATRDVTDLSAIAWEVVVLDEAQAVKNHLTKAARAVRKLDARQKIALTGTPVENRLTELWSILDAVNPGMLGGPSWFAEHFASPIQNDSHPRALEALHQLTRPVLLRRTKADRSLVPDLPDKVEQVAWATLTAEQASLYKAVVDHFLTAAPDAEGMDRRGLVLATLTRLKQICNHPAHFLPGEGKLTGRSGKLSRFDELVDQILDAGERALVFTQYREMGELLVRHLHQRLHLDVPFLHGGVSKRRRDAMVGAFQAGEGPPLQLVSLKAGGTGLNLTAASRVIHYDRWWNPAVENQATDRAWRIGQRATVFVHKLVCRGTLEERIDALLADKQQLADITVGNGEAWLTEMSTDTLRGLVLLGGDATGDRAARAG